MYTNVMTHFQSQPHANPAKERARYIRDAFHVDTVTYAEIPKFTDTSKIEHFNIKLTSDNVQGLLIGESAQLIPTTN